MRKTAQKIDWTFEVFSQWEGVEGRDWTGWS